MSPVAAALRRLMLCVACTALAAATASQAAPAPMREITSLELAREMSPGINLGNTLEARPAETSWGNPPPNRRLMNAYKAAGFRSVRIPVAWSQYVDADDRIRPAWMAHVRQTVDDARAAGLIAMINIHWDGGWMDHPFRAKQAAINARLKRLWTQIAAAFEDCDEGVLFAGTNEVMEENVWSTPTAENLEVQASFNQAFVDAVRATGGHNAKRHLVVQAYNTNFDYAVKWAVMPKDSVADRLMLEVHYYDPYDFALNEKSRIWQWGAIAQDPEAVQHWADEAYADAKARSLRERFIDQGVPVIVGEYGAYPKRAFPGMQPYVHHWIREVTTAMRRHGLVPMWWDTGALFDRRSGEQKDPQTIRLIVESGR
ncbi:MAG TPA: glycoside hydrolase family 5 protein [Burkholderiaceae bacterium]